MKRGALLPALALLSLAALTAACSPPQPPLPAHSFPLTELAASSRAVVETDAIDIGAKEHRSALWSGWGLDETYPEGNFAWGAGRRSLLRFDVIEPRDRRLRLRGWSYPFGDAPPQEVSFSIRGREIARRKLAPEPGTIELELPKDALVVGENLLEIEYSRHAEGGAPWAAGWDTLRFDGPRASATPRIEGRDRIVIPARTALEWTLELTGGSWLAWKSQSATGDARLALAIVTEENRREELPPRGANRLQLPAEGEPYRLHTISLRALGGSGEVRLANLRLHAPDLGPRGARKQVAAPAPRTAPETATETASPAPIPTTAPAAAPKPPNLILYIVDTLRADHLGCYGYRRPTSPALDAFARERAVLFTEARAQSSWTRPAIATLLTGLHPVAHGAQQTDERLAERIVTLAERLQSAGWQTAMVTTNGNVARRFGFGQGFDRFTHLTERMRRPETHVRSSDAQKVALEWVDGRDPSRPFFLVIHTSDPHDPYTPGPRFRKQFAPDVTDPRIGTRNAMAELPALKPEKAAALRAALVSLYDGEIAQNDESFGRLVAELAKRGLDRESALVFTADHGEEFFEHGGWKHGRTLYEEQLRVPLLLALPDRSGAGTTVADPVEQVDVTPTLLALAGLPRPKELPGRSLVGAVDGDHALFSPGHVSYAWLQTRGLVLASVVRSQWKLIDNRAPADPTRTPPYELFSLGSDPEERSNRALKDWLRRSWLVGQLSFGQAEFGSLEPAERTEIDPELRETLRALGYL